MSTRVESIQLLVSWVCIKISEGKAIFAPKEHIQPALAGFVPEPRASAHGGAEHMAPPEEMTHTPVSLFTCLRSLRFSLILICLALTGCGSAVPAAPAPAQTRLPFSTPTEQPLPTNSPVALIIATLPPPATAEPTLPPLPTSDNSAPQIWRLLANNGGCRLPCFWGITPGKTTTAEFLQFMSQFPNESEGMDRSRGIFRVYYIPPVGNTDTNDTVEFFEQNSVIEAVGIDGDTVPLSFPLTRLLKEYGMPDQVLFGGNMYVLYEQQRIVSAYELSIQDNYLCYNPQQAAGIVTWAEGRDWVSDVNRFFNVIGPKVSASSLKPIEQVTEYDLVSFYKKFSAANRSICMKTLTPNP